MKQSVLPSLMTNHEMGVENLFIAIHENCSKAVFLYALGQIQNEEFAEEITQNTFVKIFTKVKAERLLQMAKEEKGNGKTALELYIFQVAKRCVIDFTRSSDYKSFKRSSALEPIHEKSEETNYSEPFSNEMQAALKTLPHCGNKS